MALFAQAVAALDASNINPSHPSVERVEVAEPVPLPFDARLLRVVAGVER